MSPNAETAAAAALDALSDPALLDTPYGDPRWLRTVPVAHRGLHDKPAGLIENSLPAFEAAIAAGYAFELDVVLSADGEAMVFHDSVLDRLTARRGPVDHLRAEQLSALPLTGGHGATIPTLAEVLRLTAGCAPILIELKSLGRAVGPMETRVAHLLSGYRGPVAVQSFNPRAMAWFARHAPHIPRGQLSMAYGAESAGRLSPLARYALKRLWLNRSSKPHFIGYRAEDLPQAAVTKLRARGLPVLAWTVTSQEDETRLRPHIDNVIFEGYRA